MPTNVVEYYSVLPLTWSLPLALCFGNRQCYLGALQGVTVSTIVDL